MTSFGTARAGAGEWIGLLGERTVVLLPPQHGALAARLWSGVDAGDGFEPLLDVLVRDGLTALPSCVLVEVEQAGGLRLLVRGTPQVRIHLADSTTRVVDSGAGLWHEERVAGVVGFEIDPGGGSWADQPFAPGLRRVGAIAWGSASLDSPVLAPPAESPAEPVAEPVVGPVAEQVAGPFAGPLAPVPGDPSDETAPLAAVPPAPPVPPVPPAPATPAFAAPAAPLPASHPEEAATDVLEAVTDVIFPDAPDRETLVQPVARVTFSHGLVAVLDGPCVVGRAPTASASGFSSARTVSVPSPLGEVSASHVEIFPGVGPQAGAVMVVDLGSTNGTVVRTPGRPPVELVPGAPWVLAADAVVDLGDGASFRIAPI